MQLTAGGGKANVLFFARLPETGADRIYSWTDLRSDRDRSELQHVSHRCDVGCRSAFIILIRWNETLKQVTAISTFANSVNRFGTLCELRRRLHPRATANSREQKQIHDCLANGMNDATGWCVPPIIIVSREARNTVLCERTHRKHLLLSPIQHGAHRLIVGSCLAGINKHAR